MEKNYKRKDRSMSSDTKALIRQKLRAYYSTHKRDDEWRKKISVGVKSYWDQLPKKDSGE